MKPLSCIPLLGCTVEDSPQEVSQHPCFCLVQSTTTHTFSCENLDLKHSWAAVLKAAVAGRTSADTLSNCDGPTNGNVTNGQELQGEECVTNGNVERCV